MASIFNKSKLKPVQQMSVLESMLKDPDQVMEALDVFTSPDRLGRLMRCASEDRTTKHTPVELQMGLLGLDDNVLRALKGRKVLEVACGNGKMVEFMRSKGIDAQGIDSEAPHGPNFIRKDVISIGGIPSNDRSYDLVLNFQNTTMNEGFPRIDEVTEIKTKLFGEKDPQIHMKAQLGVLEMVRVMKDDGRIIIYPPVQTIDVVMRLPLNSEGVKVYSEDVDRPVLEKYLSLEMVEDIALPKMLVQAMSVRMVLLRNKAE